MEYHLHHRYSWYSGKYQENITYISYNRRWIGLLTVHGLVLIKLDKVKHLIVKRTTKIMVFRCLKLEPVNIIFIHRSPHATKQFHLTEKKKKKVFQNMTREQGYIFLSLLIHSDPPPGFICSSHCQKSFDNYLVQEQCPKCQAIENSKLTAISLMLSHFI